MAFRWCKSALLLPPSNLCRPSALLPQDLSQQPLPTTSLSLQARMHTRAFASSPCTQRCGSGSSWALRPGTCCSPQHQQQQRQQQRQQQQQHQQQQQQQQLLAAAGLRQQRAVRCSAANKEEDYDLVTRWVGKIFGQAAVEDQNPMGLKRMDWSQVKDLEVTTDRWAAPVATDDPLMARIRPLLAGTQLEEEPLRCAFSATEDGWNPVVFHERVDGYGAAIVVARTVGGAVIGGYNPLGYDGYGNKSTLDAFLFTWPDGDLSARPHKLPKVSTDQMAIVDGLDLGIHFGCGDLKMLMQRGNPTRATCKLIDYARLPGGGKTLFNKDAESPTTTQLVELRVFVRKGGKLKYELDGLRWKSSYADDGSGEGPPPGIFSL